MKHSRTIGDISPFTLLGRLLLAAANRLGRLNSQWETRNGRSCRAPQHERMIGRLGPVGRAHLRQARPTENADWLTITEPTNDRPSREI